MMLQQLSERTAGPEVGESVTAARQFAGEDLPGSVARVFGQGVDDDQTQRRDAQRQIEDPRPGRGAADAGREQP